VGGEASPREQLLDRRRSGLLVIDLQDAYRGLLHEEARTVGAAVRLLRGVALLGVPVLVTEQYPRGLGPTREEVAGCLPPGTPRLEKTSFSALGAQGLPERLEAWSAAGRDQAVVIGIETHVCVGQTVHELLDAGWQVHVVRDAVTARFALEDETGWAKLLGAGAIPASSEAVLFEWLRDSRAPEFKSVHKLVV
jgi:isochorismate hydrolase